MEIIKKLTTKNCYKNANKPSFIVVHETDNTDKEADALRHAQALANGNLSTSVHYFVDDKNIVQVLSHSDGAWAVGKSYGTPIVRGVNNKNSINIEICVNKDGNYNKARAKCIELVKHLMNTTGIQASKVIRHYDAKKKICPRHMVNDPDLWIDFKKQITTPPIGAGIDDKKEIDTAIVFANSIDEIAAEILHWKKQKAMLLEVSSVKRYNINHVIAIGVAATDLPHREIVLQGTNRYDTVQKVLNYINLKE